MYTILYILGSLCIVPYRYIMYKYMIYLYGTIGTYRYLFIIIKYYLNITINALYIMDLFDIIGNTYFTYNTYFQTYMYIYIIYLLSNILQ